ncbi:MAG: universal stress protein [Armatimonadetes bacterium]|nr:universal stress protein [Armatimonadota bacterium]
MFKKILICVDDSPVSDRIAEVGADIARRYNADAILLSVLDAARFARPPFSGLEAVAMVDHHSRSLTNNAYRLHEELQAEGVNSRVMFLPGQTAQMILSVADQEQTDLIIMGGDAKNWMRSLLEGNLWSEVSRAAPCNVLRVGKDATTIVPPVSSGKEPRKANVPATATVSQNGRPLIGGLG